MTIHTAAPVTVTRKAAMPSSPPSTAATSTPIPIQSFERRGGASAYALEPLSAKDSRACMTPIGVCVPLVPAAVCAGAKPGTLEFTGGGGAVAIGW